MKRAIPIGAMAWLLGACGGSEPAPATPATSGSASVDSGTSPPVADAEKVVTAMRADFRKCYNDALANNPKVEGSMTLEVKVDPSGSVTAAAPTGTTTLPASVTDCLAKRVQQAKFAPPGGNGSTLQIPITFKSGS